MGTEVGALDGEVVGCLVGEEVEAAIGLCVGCVVRDQIEGVSEGYGIGAVVGDQRIGSETGE